MGDLWTRMAAVVYEKSEAKDPGGDSSRPPPNDPVFVRRAPTFWCTASIARGSRSTGEGT